MRFYLSSFSDRQEREGRRARGTLVSYMQVKEMSKMPEKRRLRHFVNGELVELEAPDVAVQTLYGRSSWPGLVPTPESTADALKIFANAGAELRGVVTEASYDASAV